MVVFSRKWTILDKHQTAEAQSHEMRDVLGAHIWGERTVRLDGSARSGT